ncbi:helix-turn-helix domain-containing protein [Fructobacillus ficulneus]|uniref:HTH cro/C1-type domain-containing protein n=1 Tax=Fructobacillus ficulneus TaxID=157463 RepID=A0A0K8MF95_9LACO|nr:helix-turn-helix transcriptional regulator [Fructobacillus ficulneus]GAO99211.1 hypothetical protein FFIC_090350 [Fructobacillus ficulneus]
MEKNRIRELREEEGLTLKQLSEKLGVTYATLSRYETGVVKTGKHEVWQKLADFFHVDVDFLQGLDIVDITKDTTAIYPEPKTPADFNAMINNIFPSFNTQNVLKNIIENTMKPIKDATEKARISYSARSRKQAKKLVARVNNDELSLVENMYVVSVLSLLSNGDETTLNNLAFINEYLNLAITDGEVFDDETFKPEMIKAFSEVLEYLEKQNK